MSNDLKKYLWDILNSIERIDKAIAGIKLEEFSADYFLMNGVERNFEIIGEALKRILVIQPEIKISETRKIIGMRNIIAHNYDSVEAINLWGTIKKNFPTLKNEVHEILQQE